MGYRSEVVLALTEQKFSELLKSVDDEVAIEIVNGADKLKEKDGWVLLYYSGVIWYDQYKKVEAINKFVHNLDQEEYDYHIMGEDVDDYKQGGCGNSPFDIHLSRSLEFTW